MKLEDATTIVRKNFDRISSRWYFERKKYLYVLVHEKNLNKKIMDVYLSHKLKTSFYKQQDAEY